MVNPEILRRRLNRFAEYLGILQRFRQYDRDTFLSDPEHYGSAERFLQLAIEATLDMGSHIIADQNLGSIEQRRDIPRCLREHGYISEAVEHNWIQMIGFRNILVHDYLEVDRNLVYEVACKRLGDLEELKQIFAGFL